MDLIIDTSSEELLVLLKSKDEIYANEKTNTKHLEHLLPQIDSVLNKANANLSDVKNFCVVVGPGSFTGVRIGVCTIKAFMQNSSAKILPIDMLEFLTFVLKKRNLVSHDFYIAIKSTSTKFYTCFGSKSAEIAQKQMVSLSDLENLSTSTQIFAYRDCLKNTNIKAKSIQVDCGDYIDYIQTLKDKKLFVTENELKPIYMALSQAEEELAKKERETSAKNN